MPKFDPTIIDTLRNDASAVGALNDNFTRISEVLEDVLSRDGTSPNTMTATLDMNSNRIVNLPFPLSPSEPARLQDISDVSTDLNELFQDAEDILDEAIATSAAIVPAAEASASAASASEIAAAASAVTAQAAATDSATYAAKRVATSSTSLSIGTGSKVFTTQADKDFIVGNYVIATRGTSDFMWGQVASYTGTTLTLTVEATSGSGTYTDWTLSVSSLRGPEGATGPTGPVGSGSGDVGGPVSSVNNNIVLFSGTSGKTIKDSGAALGSLASASSINNSNWSGTDLSLDNGGTGASLTDPNADRIMFWDDSAGAVTWLTPGTGLAITTTTIAISDAELLAIAGLTSAADTLPYFTGSGTASLATLTTAARSLLDDADAATMRTTLGLGNVSNTSDANKPVSSATQTALDDKVDLGTAFYATSTKSTAFTPASNEIGYLYTVSGTYNITTPSSTTTASMPVGSYYVFYNSSGTKTFVAGSGITLRTPTGTTLIGTGAMCALVRVSSTVWVVQGAMV